MCNDKYYASTGDSHHLVSLQCRVSVCVSADADFKDVLIDHAEHTQIHSDKFASAGNKVDLYLGPHPTMSIR